MKRASEREREEPGERLHMIEQRHTGNNRRHLTRAFDSHYTVGARRVNADDSKLNIIYEGATIRG